MYEKRFKLVNKQEKFPKVTIWTKAELSYLVRYVEQQNSDHYLPVTISGQLWDPKTCKDPECDFQAAYYQSQKASGMWRKCYENQKARCAELESENEKLRARANYLEKQLYGKKQEKTGGKTTEKQIENSEDKKSRGQQPGNMGHGRRLHDHLPIKEEIHALAETETQCLNCGLAYTGISATEDSEEIEIEVKAYRRVIRRKKYKKTCQCEGVPAIIVAPSPPKLIPKGGYSISFWAHVLIDKYQFQCPTYRLLTELNYNSDLIISQGTVTDGLKRLSELFPPIYEQIIKKNQTDHHWHADETRWEVFEHVEGKTSSRWYFWVFKSKTAVVFRCEKTRGGCVVTQHFEHCTGIISADRYGAYKIMLKTGRVLIAYCWTHIRRDFLDVVTGYDHLQDWGMAWVTCIGDLYYLNEQRLGFEKGTSAFKEKDMGLRKYVGELNSRLHNELNDPKIHPIGKKVLISLKNHWSGAILFVDHPEIPMDNNSAERTLRNLVNGRKNYYGSGAVWSSQLAAMMFSIFQTLLLWRLNIKKWLIWYLTACAQNNGKAPLTIEPFLPWNLTETQRENLLLKGSNSS